MTKAILFVLILVLDQLTKHLALTELELDRPLKVIDGLFNLTLVMNPGAAFGMFGGLADPTRRIVLGVVSVVAVVVVLRLAFREVRHDSIALSCLTAILAGAAGNLIDRFRFDSVVDFLDFYVGRYHWPAFNVADSAICLGVAIVLLRMTFIHKPETASLEDGHDTVA